MSGALSLDLSGSATERGRGQARAGMTPQVRAATLGRVEAARAEGLLDADAAVYLQVQHAFHMQTDPEGMAELDGIALGFGFDPYEMFIHLHLGTLRDLKGGAALEDGCSAWATGAGPDGPLVVKNRDFSGTHLGIQSVARHSGPDIRTGATLCLGSLGSPGAYSSGINARGLALADTQVAVNVHGVGWLRYFLMTRILARCSTVSEAIALIRSRPHAGGGTLVLADAGGATATVELGAAGPQIETGSLSLRTNHYVTPALEKDTMLPEGDCIASNSRQRFSFLSGVLPAGTWDRAAACSVMATHPQDGAPLCQHGAADGTQTIASAVYSCAAPGLLACTGSPCRSEWISHDLTG
ncbi:Acyl-coenzyme A:6-aminopenicillanic acid acyl-transferase [Salipiger thiooxidans]|uniref:Acyl-coenzyme A:6-aminopenicillanic acid acyl-transferase n=1 Tax=Salipiger thiooxidans TaxID=282683 RepID=A0A1G7N368_9RHOB|nr:C45 family peptidase [Salipiger thiooxidans]SDF68381.1 Acyl-coenzyme A:6-aminopenicillanic acid acyl-transferase [Salipiger thiooxidans]